MKRSGHTPLTNTSTGATATRQSFLDYPTSFRWFNLWHRATLIFVALLSVASLISYFYKDAKHDVPEGHFMEYAGILAIVVILITMAFHYFTIREDMVELRVSDAGEERFVDNAHLLPVNMMDSGFSLH